MDLSPENRREVENFLPGVAFLVGLILVGVWVPAEFAWRLWKMGEFGREGKEVT